MCTDGIQFQPDTGCGGEHFILILKMPHLVFSTDEAIHAFSLNITQPPVIFLQPAVLKLLGLDTLFFVFRYISAFCLMACETVMYNFACFKTFYHNFSALLCCPWPKQGCYIRYLRYWDRFFGLVRARLRWTSVNIRYLGRFFCLV